MKNFKRRVLVILSLGLILVLISCGKKKDNSSVGNSESYLGFYRATSDIMLQNSISYFLITPSTLKDDNAQIITYFADDGMSFYRGVDVLPENMVYTFENSTFESGDFKGLKLNDVSQVEESYKTTYLALKYALVLTDKLKGQNVKVVFNAKNKAFTQEQIEDLKTFTNLSLEKILAIVAENNIEYIVIDDEDSYQSNALSYGKLYFKTNTGSSALALVQSANQQASSLAMTLDEVPFQMFDYDLPLTGISNPANRDLIVRIIQMHGKAHLVVLSQMNERGVPFSKRSNEVRNSKIDCSKVKVDTKGFLLSEVSNRGKVEKLSGGYYTLKMEGAYQISTLYKEHRQDLFADVADLKNHVFLDDKGNLGEIYGKSGTMFSASIVSHFSKTSGYMTYSQGCMLRLN